MNAKYGFSHCVLVWLGLCALAACRGTSQDPSQALFDADRAFARDVRTRRLEAWVEWFDSEGSQVDQEFRPITGHDAIRRNMLEFFDQPDSALEWEPDLARLSEGGKLGLTSGRFRLIARQPDGSLSSRTGRYFDVWRKQSDGSWKVLYDLGDFDRE